MIPEAFGDRLAFALTHSGLEKHQLANLLAVQPTVLDREMQCRGPITESLTLPQLRELCRWLGVSWAWLVEGAPTPSGVAAARRMRQGAANVLDPQELDYVCSVLETME